MFDLYCLVFPIKVPEGHWFCSDCRPKETRRGERRKRPAAKDEEDDDEHTNRSEEGSNSVDEASDDEEDDSESESESDENGMQSKWLQYEQGFRDVLRLVEK